MTSQGPFQPKAFYDSMILSGEEKAEGNPVNVYTYLMGRNEDEGARLLSTMLSYRTRGNEHKLKNVEFQHNKTLFYCEGSQTQEQVTQKDCGVSISDDTKNPTGHGPGQSALSDLA